MRFIDAAQVAAALSYPTLVDTLDRAFRVGAISPLRHHHRIALDNRPEAMLLLMPAWQASSPGALTAGAYIGIKMVTVFPDNGIRRQQPSIAGVYLLLSSETGEPLAILDAPTLTVWRTAAASALAARYVSRADASRMVMVGAGALAEYLIRAHASVRPIRHVAIWNRSQANAEKLAAKFAGSDLDVTVADDLEAAVRSADLIATATISSTPVIKGAWLKPGCHLDCVGAYRPDMRESDDDCVTRAKLWVDTRAGGLNEAGDVVMPLQAGVITETHVLGDLYDLARGQAPLRTSATDITMFKSVGASIEDLATAVAVYETIVATAG
jgi:ornithine cyclodeaminase/alanine dehydrogenase-like protein (mu-crystallin family)